MIPIARPTISDDELKKVEEVLKSGYWVSGKKVEEFERKFAEHIGVKHAIAISSGTAALHVALLTSGIKEGDEVITSSFSFIASSNAALFVGARPVFVDINEKTFNIDPDKIEEKITERTKAILPVHLYGQPCEIKKISEMCEKHGLFLIEDAAQAHGAEYEGKKVGSFGNLNCFSFYATKNLPIGEGGMITTNDEELAERVREIVNQGQSKKYYHTVLGYNFRMMEFQAAIGIEKLKKLDKNNKKRIKNAEFLTKNLSGVDGIISPFVLSNVKHVFHQYVIKSTYRNKLQNYLSDNGIQNMIHYPMPIFKQPLYQKLGFKIRLPIVEKVAKQVLSLPVHPSLSREDLNHIVEKVKAFKD